MRVSKKQVRATVRGLPSRLDHQLRLASLPKIWLAFIGIEGMVALRKIGLAFAFASVSSIAIAADTPPHLDTSGVNMQPAYPASAAKNSERGAVVLGVNVSKTGTVNYVYPMQTSGFADLDSAAVAGVLGWRFIPATSGGTNTDGNTAVEIVFEPPPSTGDAASAAAAPPPPKPARNFLPATFSLEAKRGEFDEKVVPALCLNGSVKATMEFLHSRGAAGEDWTPVAGLMVRTDKKHSVAVHMDDVEYFSPPAEKFEMEHYDGTQETSLDYSFMAHFATPQTVQISWDSRGLVTAWAGLETRQAQLSAPPSEILFTMSSGAAKFTNPILICKQANSG